MKTRTILLTLILFVAVLYGCNENPTEIIDPNDPVADAGENQTINVGSYFVLDGSKSTKGKSDTLIYKWEEDPNNPESVYLYDNPIHYKAVFTEGTYKYTLVVNNGIMDSKQKELIIKINPRTTGIIEDPTLESFLRFNIGKQIGQLTASDLLKVDSLKSSGGLASYMDIKSLNGIENCKNIRVLILSLEDITDISPLSSLTNLERLDIDQNRDLTDISSLSTLSQLKHLNISSIKVNDINILAPLINLNYLNILFTQVTEISVVSNFKKLQEFWGGELTISDLSIFTELTELQLFFLTFSNITDISALTNHTNLKQIEISENEISDISPLINSKEMITLRITDNNITEISVLEHLEKLTDIRLSRNKIEDIEPLVKNEGIQKGVIIELIGNPLNEKSINEYIPQLVARGVIIYF